MKRSPSLITAILSCGLLIPLGIATNTNSNTNLIQPVKAEEQIVQTYAYDQMVILSSSIAGNDITKTNSDPNALIDYGFRHGNVANGNINKFETYGDNRLGTDGVNAASFLNWRMSTGNGDGAIIMFKANQKVIFNVKRPKLGYDWRNEITLSIFKNNTLLDSKDLSDSSSTADDFSFTCVLEKDEILYWQILSHATDNARHISMGNAGDYSTLPTFTISEYVEYPSREATLSELVTDYISSSDSTVLDECNMFKYSFQTGNIETNALTNATKETNYISLGNSSINTNGKITLGDNGNILFKLTTTTSTTLVINYSDVLANYEDIKVSYYITNTGRTKHAYTATEIDEAKYANLSKTFVINANESVLVSISNTSDTTKTNLDLLEGLKVEQIPSNSSIKSEYPIYTPTDYSTRTTITHKELAFETARLQCAPVTLQDINITILTGTVNETIGEDLNKFDTIKYEDGNYLYGQNVQPSMILAGPNGTFNSDDEAVVEDYRLQTSIKEAVVYKMTATKDTELKVTHPATTGGWVGDGVYIGGFQNNTKITKCFYKEAVDNSTVAADTYAVTYHLAAGDTAYYVFGSDMANRRNFNIAPIFTTNEENYSSAAREEIFGPVEVEAFLYDVVTDTINNGYQPVTYEETLTIGLYHGTVETKELFSFHKGDGQGTEKDALVVGSGNDSDCGFQRWQFHAGLNNDNAIMQFTAERDLKLTISHKEMGTMFYNEGGSLKYYILDTDGFADYQEERYLSKDTPADYYGYVASLKAGQSLLIEFTANDPEGYAVAAIEWIAKANPKEFNPNETNDFTEARDLQAYKDQLVAQLEEYVNGLYPGDYSVNNYSRIEAYLDTFINDIKKLSHVDEIYHLYEKALADIEAVKTLDEEAAELEAAKTNAIAEAEAYINAKKDTYTDKEWETVLEEFDAFKLAVTFETSITNINIKLIEFKTLIDTLPATAEQVKTNTIIISCSVGGAVLLAGLVTVIIIIAKKKKAK